MSLSGGTAFVDLTLGKTAGLKSGMAAEAESASSNFGSKFKSGLFGTMAGLAGPLVGIMALDKLFEFVKGGAADWSALQASTRQTNAVLTSTGGTANVTAQSINTLTSSLSKKTAMDQTAIRTGENMLLTFTNVKNGVGKGNDVFNQATATILDMSKALGQDTKSSAMQLGKALNDPIKGVAALQRVGVSFTASQKEQIKSLTASGNAMGAQKIILAELNKEFGGSAAASATGGAKLSLTMKDLAMNLYGLLVPLKTIGITFSTFLVTPIADAVSKLIPIEQKMVGDFKKTFNSFKDEAAAGGNISFDGLTTPLQRASAHIGVIIGDIKRNLALVREAFSLVMDGLLNKDVSNVAPQLRGIADRLVDIGVSGRQAYEKMKPLLDRFGPMIAETLAVAGGFLALHAAIGAFGTLALRVVTMLIGPVRALMAVFMANPILLAVAAIIGVLVMLYNNSTQFRAFVDGIVAAIGPLIDYWLPILGQAFSKVWEVVGPVLQFIGQAIGQAFDFIVGLFSSGQATGGPSSFFSTIATVFNNIWSVISSVGQAIAGVFNYMFSPLEPIFAKIGPALAAIGSRFQDFFNVVKAVFDFLSPFISGALNVWLQIFVFVLQNIWTVVSSVFNALWPIIVIVFNIIMNVIRSVMTIIGGIISLILDLISGNWKGVWQDIQQIFKGVIDLIVSVARGFVQLLVGLWQGMVSLIVGLVTGFVNNIVNFFHLQGAIDAVSGFISNILGFFGGLAGKIMGAVIGIGSWLIQAGKDLVNGLIDGIKSMIGSVLDTVTGPIKAAIDGVKQLLHINSPSLVFMEIGQSIMLGLTGGITSLASSPSNALGAVAASLPRSMNVGMNATLGSTTGTAYGSNNALGHQTFNIYESTSAYSTAMAVARIQTDNARIS